jgi:DMSO/TMAO reductase YedYZ molybdopterin-dependent catalytic subunit
MALTRRGLIRGAALAAPGLVLAGCDGQAGLRVRDVVLGSGEWLAYRVQRLIGSQALAREFEPAAMSPTFRTNGNTEGSSEAWLRHAESGFAEWRLSVGGLVEAPARLSLAELRAMPARSQITRHDCVEGWSAIGKWTGVPLTAVLARVRLRPEARFVVFRCADDFWGTPYYESIDLVDALHPQTILAYGMNDGPLPVGHGAPVRLRVERQLGYKHAKFVMSVEAVASLAPVGKGRGGFWEDLAGYDWYAGI